MFTQIIINNQHMFSFIHKIFTHCTAGIRCNVLKRAGFRSCSSYNDGVIHSTVFRKVFHKVCYCGTFLSDCYICYFVTASWRRDIAGRLVKESNSGDFPAVTAAWKISSEKFFNNTNNFNLLKVRASWGKVGNLGSVPMGYKAGLMWSDFVGNETAWYGIMNNQGGNKYFWGDRKSTRLNSSHLA